MIGIKLIFSWQASETLPTSQFEIESFVGSLRLDRTRNRSGIPLHVKNKITATLLTNYTFSEHVEAFLGNCNRKVVHVTHPNLSFARNKSFGILHFKLWESILIGWLLLNETSMNSFFNLHNLKCLAQEPTWYKNGKRPSCIDLFLSNCENHFLKTEILETGRSDFHNLNITATILKFLKKPPKIVTLWNYKHHNEELFE